MTTSAPAAFGPLEHVPDGTTAVLGLVTTKSGPLEDPAVIEERIAEAARVIPLDRLALSPQCGFASVEAGNPLSVEEQDAKLRLIVQVARNIWN